MYRFDVSFAACSIMTNNSTRGICRVEMFTFADTDSFTFCCARLPRPGPVLLVSLPGRDRIHSGGCRRLQSGKTKENLHFCLFVFCTFLGCSEKDDHFRPGGWGSSLVSASIHPAEVSLNPYQSQSCCSVAKFDLWPPCGAGKQQAVTTKTTAQLSRPAARGSECENIVE